MADISQLTVNDTTYNFKDAAARERLDAIEAYSGYLGVTTTELVDNETTDPVVIVNEESKTATAGSIVNYRSKEFIYNGAVWQEFGDLSALGALAYLSSASGSFTPAGTVSKPTTTVSTTSTTVNSITDIGTLPSYTVSGETLVLTPGTLPTKGENVTVVGSVDGAETSQPTFSGIQSTVTVTAPSA